MTPELIRKSMFALAVILSGGGLWLGFGEVIGSAAPRADTAPLIPYQDKTAIALGKIIYRQHCAYCHGAKREGQTGWRDTLKDGKRLAPPHDETGHTWHHPDQQLFAITKYGLASLLAQPYPNDMPVYEDILEDTEILAVLAYIKNSWPKDIQNRHDKLNQRFRKTEQ